LVDIASRDGRKSAVIFFNGDIQKELRFEPKERDVNKYINLATTDYYCANKKVLSGKGRIE